MDGVAKTSTPGAQRSEREQRLQAARRRQAAAERRRRLALVLGAGLVALALIATAVVTIVRQQRAQDPANIGVEASAAGCRPVETVPVTEQGIHFGPGTSSPDPAKVVEYEQVPAVSGEHFVSPAYPAQPFYTAQDRPPVEQLVHNLEHGYTLAWYSPDLPADELTALEAAAEAMRRDEQTQSGKFIAAPWDEARGAFPEGAELALAHWGAEEGALQYCGRVSGEVFADFVAAHPASDSPEPNGP